MVNILFENAKLFDGEKFVDNSNFGVNTASGKIISSNNDFDNKINLHGKYVLPGLINAHTHIVADHTGKINQLGSPDNTVVKSTYLALKNLNDLLKDGVTYIRDVGSIFDIDIELAKLEKAGELIIPGIIASGSPLTMTGGHFSEGSYEVDGEDEVKKYARKLLKRRRQH